MGLTAAAAAAVCLMVGPGAAQAAPFTVTFSDGVVDIGRTKTGTRVDNLRIIDRADPATHARLGGDEAGGAIGEGDLSRITRTFRVPNPLDPKQEIDVELWVEESTPFTGTFDSPTGALDLDAPLKVTATVPQFQSRCRIDPLPIMLSSSAADPELPPGEAFTAGLAGSGAVAGYWTTLPAAVAVDLKEFPFGGLVCPILHREVQGAGGIWLAQRALLRPPPPGGGPGPGVLPKAKKCKGKKGARGAAAARKCRKKKTK
jgi:hypothetical protein